MNEAARYEQVYKKLENTCNENDLTFTLQRTCYPMTLTIKPNSSMDSQITMLESSGAEEGEYASPDAHIMYTNKDGVLVYHMSKTFTINDELFNKIKNLFNKLHFFWMCFFFRECIEQKLIADAQLTRIEDEAEGDEDA